MATNTGTRIPAPVGTALLEQLTELDAESLSPATARKLLELGFSPAHQKRVRALSEKARQGTLTTSEGQELDDFIHVGNLLAILQSKARQVLKHSAPPPSSAHGRPE